MAYRKLLNVMVTGAVALSLPLLAEAQSAVTENFTGTSTTNSWYFFLGACLTAGTQQGVQPTGTTGGTLPGS